MIFVEVCGTHDFEESIFQTDILYPSGSLLQRHSPKSLNQTLTHQDAELCGTGLSESVIHYLDELTQILTLEEVPNTDRLKEGLFRLDWAC